MSIGYTLARKEILLAREDLPDMWLLHLDETITFALYRGSQVSHLEQRLIYSLASGFVYLLPLVLLYLFFHSYRDKISSAKIFVTAILSWQVLSSFTGQFLYSHYGFRDRPFTHYGLSELLLERPQKAFPSDHAAVLFAVALSFFFYKYPKLGWLFLIGGMLSAIGRVAIGFHWMGDVLGGWAIGAIAFLIIRALDKPLTTLFDRIFTIAHIKRRTDELA